MIIEKIHIEHFGNLSDFTLEFGEGINVIEGANESGKSTISAFIRFMLYGLSSRSRDKQVSDRERYISWQAGRAQGEMVIRTEDSRYRIVRGINQTGEHRASPVYREMTEVVDLNRGSVVSDITSPGEYFLNVSEEVFTQTAFIGQLDGTDVNGESISEAVENILFSANEQINTGKALKKLDSARVALLHKNGMGGKIYELKLMCAELEEKLDGAERVEHEILEKEGALERAKANREELSKKSELLESDLLAYERAASAKLSKELAEARKENELFKREIEQISTEYFKGNVASRHEYVAMFENAVNELSASKNRLDELGRMIAAAREELEQARSEAEISDSTNIHFTRVMSAIFASITVLFSVGATAIMHFTAFFELAKILLFSTLFPFALFCVFLVLSLGRSKKRKRLSESTREAIAAEAYEKETRLGALEREYENTEENIGLLSAKLAPYFNDDNAKSTDVSKTLRDAMTKLDAAVAGEERTREIMRLIDEKLIDFDTDEFDGDVEKVKCTVTSDNVNAKRNELAFYRNAARAADTRINELERELAALYPICEKPATITERIDLAKSLISEYERKHAAYLLAKEKIGEAGERMRESISPKLSLMTGRYMSLLTNGKYSEIGVDRDLNVTVRTSDGSKKLSLLSAGTRDAAYASLRIALTDVLFKRERACEVFDESFSRLDGARLSRMLELLCERGGKHQCFIMTSNGREAEALERIGKFNHIRLDQGKIDDEV